MTGTLLGVPILTGEDVARLGSGNPAPPCSCNYAGELGEGLHAANCERWVALVQKYRPQGLRVERRRVVRDD